MDSRDPESLLPHLYPPPEGDPTAREALERALLARFDTRAAPAPSRRFRVRWVALAAAAVSGAALAMSVPTHYAVEVGKRLAIRLASPDQADAAGPLLGELARANGSQVFEIWVRIHRSGEGDEMEAEIWGDRLPADLAQQLEARLPGAAVQVQPLSGPLRVSLGRRLATTLLRRDATPEERAAARAALIVQLQQEHGSDHRFQVEVRDLDGRHEVRVKVLPEHGP
ncbi:MAG TPA: hypothetical protein VIG99_27725 [Myxococcaceae bacterium]|jgi:hypothetical protein